MKRRLCGSDLPCLDGKKGKRPRTRRKSPISHLTDYLCTLGKPRGDVKRFIDWVLSDEGQRLVRKRFVGVRSGG